MAVSAKVALTGLVNSNDVDKYLQDAEDRLNGLFKKPDGVVSKIELLKATAGHQNESVAHAAETANAGGGCAVQIKIHFKEQVEFVDTLLTFVQ